MEGGCYFRTRRSFGFIDNPPWAAGTAGGAPAAKTYDEVERAALQGESEEAYLQFVVDYRGLPAENELVRLRAGGIRVYEELAAVSKRDGYGYGYGERVHESASLTASSGNSTGSINGGELGAAGGANDFNHRGGLFAAMHQGLCAAHAEGRSFDAAAAAAVPLPPTIASSGSCWVDLESPDSLLDLQDIDDSWLDSLPPLHIDMCASSISTSSSASDYGGGYASAPTPVQQLARRSLGVSPLYLLSNPNPFDGFPESLYPAHFEASPVAVDVTPAPREPSPPDIDTSSSQASPATACPSLLSSDRKRLKRLDLGEPKYVVLTSNYESVLKDGFKWRKYGQKSVKNNIYPRSYYKCSYEGCYVHKHVERVALDPCLILTTYRGVVYAMINIGVLGFTAWAYYMFTIGLDMDTHAYFMATIMTIVVLTRIKVPSKIVIMWGGLI
ncbi:hypothetical protein L7F22_052055 [Adiantum nelumboides]|nr:hypothetical protein [Adiantum nelumboides]